MVELSLEEDLHVAMFSLQVDNLNEAECKFLMKQLYRQMLIKDALWKNLAKSSWGMSEIGSDMGTIKKETLNGETS